MGVEEAVDPEGYDLGTSVCVRILIKVRSVVQKSSSVARLDTALLPLFLPDFTRIYLRWKRRELPSCPKMGNAAPKAIPYFLQFAMARVDSSSVDVVASLFGCGTRYGVHAVSLRGIGIPPCKLNRREGW